LEEEKYTMFLFKTEINLQGSVCYLLLSLMQGARKSSSLGLIGDERLHVRHLVLLVGQVQQVSVRACEDRLWKRGTQRTVQSLRPWQGRRSAQARPAVCCTTVEARPLAQPCARTAQQSATKTCLFIVAPNERTNERTNKRTHSHSRPAGSKKCCSGTDQQGSMVGGCNQLSKGSIRQGAKQVAVDLAALEGSDILTQAACCQPTTHLRDRPVGRRCFYKAWSGEQRQGVIGRTSTPT
jgi:hypothetical protein